mgnify:FL=1
MKYEQLLSDLELHVNHQACFNEEYVILLEGLLKLRFNVSERFYEGITTLVYNKQQTVRLIKNDVAGINNPSKNTYYLFYLQVLDFVNSQGSRREIV